MSGGESTSLLEEMLGARDPWAAIGTLASGWSDELAALCEARFETADADGRKRLVWLLERVRTSAALAVLLRRLSAAVDDEAAQILRVLNGARVVVPTEQIVRHLRDATVEAVVAAGISGDASLTSRLAEQLDAPSVRRHAALALAMLGRKELTAEIASRIEGAKGLEASGLIVALEEMNDASVAPKLLELMARPSAPHAWDLHHALWRLTGREPLVRFAKDRSDASRAFAAAWRGFDLAAPPRPRIAGVRFEPPACASFELHDGGGVVRIDYDPPSPGSSWPRWGKSLFVGRDRLFEIGSDCGTCETALRATGSASSAAHDAQSVREALAHVTALDEATLRALEPYLTRLRTGHYLARVVDLDVDRVTAAEDSWLTRRAEHRGSDEPIDPSDVSWPGAEHFQVRRAALGAFPTYGLILPQASLGALRPEVVEAWEAAIRGGTRPTALVMAWVEQKDIGGAFTERFLVSVVLDGHHKLSAYARLRRPARVLAICRLEDSWGPPEDRSRWLREAFAALEGERG